jgi:surface antigen
MARVVTTATITIAENIFVMTGVVVRGKKTSQHEPRHRRWISSTAQRALMTTPAATDVIFERPTRYAGTPAPVSWAINTMAINNTRKRGISVKAVGHFYGK